MVVLNLMIISNQLEYSGYDGATQLSIVWYDNPSFSLSWNLDDCDKHKCLATWLEEDSYTYENIV